MNYLLLFLSASLFTSLAFSSSEANDELNQFKQTKSCVNCDLSGTDLSSGNYHHAILRGTNLSLANLYGSNFDFSDFGHASLVKSVLKNASMKYSNFDNCDFLYVQSYSYSISLGNSSFNGSSFQNVNFNHAKLSYTNFTNTDLSGASFKDAILDNAIFIGSTMTLDQIKQAKSAKGAVLADGSIYKD